MLFEGVNASHPLGLCMVRVQVEVPESQRDSWDEYVDDNGEVDSRADLIRLAVEQYISDGNTSGSQSLNGDALDDLHAELADVREEIAETQTQIRAHRHEAPSEEGVEDIMMTVMQDTIMHLTDADDVEVRKDPEYGVKTVRDMGDVGQLVDDEGPLPPEVQLMLDPFRDTLGDKWLGEEDKKDKESGEESDDDDGGEE